MEAASFLVRGLRLSKPELKRYSVQPVQRPKNKNLQGIEAIAGLFFIPKRLLKPF
jgi:hypothetical protein